DDHLAGALSLDGRERIGDRVTLHQRPVSGGRTGDIRVGGEIDQGGRLQQGSVDGHELPHRGAVGGSGVERGRPARRGRAGGAGGGALLEVAAGIDQLLAGRG